MTDIILLPASLRDPANTLAVRLGVDPKNTGTFNCALVPSSGAADATATYYGAWGDMGEAPREVVVSDIGQFPGAIWYRLDAANRCTASFDGSQVGKVMNFDRALALNGLQRQVSKSPRTSP